MTQFIERLIAPLLLAVLVTACSSGPAPRPVATAKAAPAPVVASATKAASKEGADVRFRAALQLMTERKSTEAQQAFHGLSKDFPELSGPLTDLGILYARGKQRDQAIASFAKAVAANPENAVALNWCGALYREAGNFQRAEQFYLKALAAKPDYAAAALNLGILYEVSMRRPQEALLQYRRYQQLSGKDDLIVTAWIKDLETSNANVAVNTMGDRS